jgi:hypothetical protein
MMEKKFASYNNHKKKSTLIFTYETVITSVRESSAAKFYSAMMDDVEKARGKWKISLSQDRKLTA